MDRRHLSLLLLLALATPSLARTYDRTTRYAQGSLTYQPAVNADGHAVARRRLAEGDYDYHSIDEGVISDAPTVVPAQLAALNAIKTAWGDFTGAHTWDASYTQSDAWSGLDISDEGDVLSIRLLFSNVNGPFPSQIAALTALTSIDLRNNALTGPIPKGVFSKLTGLRQLYLSDNQLTGAVPWWAIFGVPDSPLGMFELDGNAFTGTIPQGIFKNVPSLQMFGVSGNKFTGGIPAAMSGCQLLSVIDLSGNALTGGLPSSVGGMSSLEVFDVSSNQLTGYLPGSFGHLPYVTNINLSNNRLSGYAPSTLANLGQSLRGFNISNNFFTGALPKFPNLGRGCGPDQSDAVSCYRFTTLLDLSGNYFFKEVAMTVQAAEWTSTPETTVICPGEDFPEQITVQNNCVSSTTTCTAEEQRPAAECSAFCGTGLRTGQCGGLGLCVPNVNASDFLCKCKAGAVLSADGKTCTKAPVTA